MLKEMDKMTGILEPKVNGETALDRLFAALCLGEDKPFLMLASYADETGHADDPNKNYLGMAALLADSGKWAEFDKEWKKICEEEGVESPFHMTEFASFQKQFSEKKWRNEEKRRRLLGRFLDAIEGIGALPLGAVVNVSDFRSLTEEQRKALGAQREEPYYVAFQGCTHLLSFSAALKSYPPKRISMVYAELKKFTGQAENLWLSMQKNTFLGRSIMDSYTRGDPAGFTPLQAADFWAYELGHHFQYIVPNQKELRYPFKRFLQMGMREAYGSPLVTYFNRERLLQILGELA